MGILPDLEKRIHAAHRVVAFVHSLSGMGDPCERKNATTKPKNLHDDSAGYRILKEGEAEILIHRNDVFYNKAQVNFDRSRTFYG